MEDPTRKPRPPRPREAETRRSPAGVAPPRGRIGGRERAPAWWLLLLGAELALALARHPAPPGPSLEPPAPGAVDLRTAPARELRRLPGVGRSRAEAIVRARWERGGMPPLEEIRGIGLRTAARIEALPSGPTRGEPPQAPEAPRRAAGPPPSGE